MSHKLWAITCFKLKRFLTLRYLGHRAWRLSLFYDPQGLTLTNFPDGYKYHFENVGLNFKALYDGLVLTSSAFSLKSPRTAKRMP